MSNRPVFTGGSRELAIANFNVHRIKANRAKATEDKYRYDPTGYITDKLGWVPWSGDSKHPGQVQVLDAIAQSLHKQVERRDYSRGTLEQHELKHYQIGELIPNRFRLAAGHTVGKTKVASGTANWYFDCYTPSIIYTFAPSWKQVHDLLWKEIKTDRRGKGLPGRILDLRLERADNHFASGIATNDNDGTGTERVQGQHNEFIAFILDEAEGIPQFVFDSIESMMSGGIGFVLLLGNPRTRVSQFHKYGARKDTRNFTLSCIWHPNVVADKEIVPGAVQRQYVENMLETHCTPVPLHKEEENTFTVPWREGVIYRPDGEFMFRVLGVAPANSTDNTLIPTGLFEAALERDSIVLDIPGLGVSQIGVDVARWGKDKGTCYVYSRGVVRRAAVFEQQDNLSYWAQLREVILEEARNGAIGIDIRIDGGGGFGAGIIDLLGKDLELYQQLKAISVHIELVVREVQFGGSAYDFTAHANMATEMHYHAIEVLKAVRVEDVPEELAGDLCERLYDWHHWRGHVVKKLEEKTAFKKRLGRSPDDGDGFVLATTPAYVLDDIQIDPDNRVYPFDEIVEWGAQL